MAPGGDDGTTNWDFIIPVTHQTTVPAGYTGIYTPQDLDNVRNGLLGKYILMNDIDLADFNNGEWVPIGSESNGFKGVFDGNGYTIHNMKITKNDADGIGLFCRISSAELKNTALADVNIVLSDTSAPVGNFCGYSDGNTPIDNCFAKGKITIDSESATYIGGVCGYHTGTTVLYITNCFNESDISVTNASSIGGILGRKFWPNRAAYISNCYNTGNITVSQNTPFVYSYVYTGGIIGDACAIINNCYNSGNISASAETLASAAGIISHCGSQSEIDNSYNAGNIYAFSKKDARAAGGIATMYTTGNSWGSSIQNFYNSGNVFAEISSEPYNNSAWASAEGIQNYGGTSCYFTISSCVVLSNRIFAENVFYPLRIRSNVIGGDSVYGTRSSTLALKEITGNAMDDADERISVEEAMSQSTYEEIGWDFDTVWTISPAINNGYPYLRGMQP